MALPRCPVKRAGLERKATGAAPAVMEAALPVNTLDPPVAAHGAIHNAVRNCCWRRSGRKRPPHCRKHVPGLRPPSATAATARDALI